MLLLLVEIALLFNNIWFVEKFRDLEMAFHALRVASVSPLRRRVPLFSFLHHALQMLPLISGLLLDCVRILGAPIAFVYSSGLVCQNQLRHAHVVQFDEELVRRFYVAIIATLLRDGPRLR